MAKKSHINWTDGTWNIITGCTPISPGCANCYASQLAGTRLKHHPSRAGLTKEVNGRHVWTGEVRFNREWLSQPLQWEKPQKIFVCAHGDLFHENVSDEWLNDIFEVMAYAQQHTFQILTKRPDRMSGYLSDLPMILPNVWIGVTVENQTTADERIPVLLDIPAAKRFLSIEPLLGPVIISLWKLSEGIDWVICGGESGPNARPMHPDWVRSLRDQCAIAGVPFFFKQWGEWLPAERDEYGNVEFCDQNTIPHDGFLKCRTTNLDDTFTAFRFGKKASGRMLDGKTWDGVPE
ncbi:DUF5131 family protein [Oxalobacter paraformigenes]|uniref:Phage Gp37/Gp68 family protein n=1 Tax=Oxalobacter paraformigenes TaxID=556268 RepID=C3X3A5_9BURK|nr:phage Gp37/Gp68 family protein [Oxalobacter paraformigenes]EEO27691.1 hypothetical protein OFAG_00844 [Oxalobacter paraformigenes]